VTGVKIFLTTDHAYRIGFAAKNPFRQFFSQYSRQSFRSECLIVFGTKSLLQIFSPQFVTTCVIDLQVGLERFFRRCEA